MNWYRQSQNIILSFSTCGFEFDGKIRGSYNPPTDYPEVTLVNARVTNVDDMYFYFELLEDKFEKEINEEVKSRLSNFGVVTNPIFVNVNGINFSIEVNRSNGHNEWEVLDAEMINSKLFLSTLPEKIENRVMDGILKKI